MILKTTKKEKHIYLSEQGHEKILQMKYFQLIENFEWGSPHTGQPPLIL